MEKRKDAERLFHNRLRTNEGSPHVTATRWEVALEAGMKDDPRWVNMKYYAIEGASREFVKRTLRGACAGGCALDYCCGNGEDGRVMAELGANLVVGMDLSEVSIRNCVELSEVRGLADRVSYVVGDAETSGFRNDSFDVISIYGSLHHLDLDKAYSELRRLLKPTGKVICTEALGHNPLISLYRRATPHLRTEWETRHILRRKDLLKAKSHFRKVETKFFYLVCLLAVPFRKKPFFGRILKGLASIDRLLFMIPGMRWWAWQVVFVLSEPRK